MTVAIADLRAAFPEFADTTTFPDSQIMFWLGQAPNQISQQRYGTSTDLATMLFVAHNIALSAQAAGSHGSVGSAQGPKSSKTVGSVSVSYDNGLTATQGAGYWNATSYGQRLLALMRSHLGPIYVPGPRPFASYSPLQVFRR